MLRIKSLEKLVHELSQLPGVGPKSAQRLAYHFLKSPSEYSHRVANALVEVQESVHECPQCFAFTDLEDTCEYCNDSRRENHTLCVVEEPGDIMGIDSSGVFRGRFHVLHGTIAPLDGVSPKDLRIDELIKRIDESRGEVKEIIFALDADIEGDTTVLYLSELLKNKGLKLTRIAHGVPIGGNIDYIDDRTIGKALENRVGL
jgi:recombination protein RecR